MLLGLYPARPGGLLLSDALPFLALLEGLIRERGPEAEQAMDDLYAEPLTPVARTEDRNAQIERLMRFGG